MPAVDGELAAAGLAHLHVGAPVVPEVGRVMPIQEEIRIEKKRITFFSNFFHVVSLNVLLLTYFLYDCTI